MIYYELLPSVCESDVNKHHMMIKRLSQKSSVNGEALDKVKLCGNSVISVYVLNYLLHRGSQTCLPAGREDTESHRERITALFDF
jgi:hypothetical protein